MHMWITHRFNYSQSARDLDDKKLRRQVTDCENIFLASQGASHIANRTIEHYKNYPADVATFGLACAYEYTRRTGIRVQCAKKFQEYLWNTKREVEHPTLMVQNRLCEQDELRDELEREWNISKKSPTWTKSNKPSWYRSLRRK